MRSVAEPQGSREHNPEQKPATAGIRPLERPTLVTRFFMRIVGWVEHLDLTLSCGGKSADLRQSDLPMDQLD